MPFVSWKRCPWINLSSHVNMYSFSHLLRLELPKIYISYSLLPCWDVAGHVKCFCTPLRSVCEASTSSSFSSLSVTTPIPFHIFPPTSLVLSAIINYSPYSTILYLWKKISISRGSSERELLEGEGRERERKGILRNQVTIRRCGRSCKSFIHVLLKLS